MAHSGDEAKAHVCPLYLNAIASTISHKTETLWGVEYLVVVHTSTTVFLKLWVDPIVGVGGSFYRSRISDILLCIRYLHYDSEQ